MNCCINRPVTLHWVESLKFSAVATDGPHRRTLHRPRLGEVPCAGGDKASSAAAVSPSEDSAHALLAGQAGRPQAPLSAQLAVARCAPAVLRRGY
jgi:hypothetical protein